MSASEKPVEAQHVPVPVTAEEIAEHSRVTAAINARGDAEMRAAPVVDVTADGLRIVEVGKGFRVHPDDLVCLRRGQTETKDDLRCACSDPLPMRTLSWCGKCARIIASEVTT